MKIDLEDMTDVCGGPMTLKTLHNEICYYMTYKQPEKMVITIDKNYYTTIYMPIKDFEKSSD